MSKKRLSRMLFVLWMMAVVCSPTASPVSVCMGRTPVLEVNGVRKPGQGRVDNEQLKAGRAIERELKGGEVHNFGITMSENQYVRVVVEQREIDVALALKGPDGKDRMEIDEVSGLDGQEEVWAVAEGRGEYRLEVAATGKETKGGRYEIRVEELREATSQDRAQYGALKLYTDGAKLYREGGGEPLRQAREKFEESLGLWRAASDRRMEAKTLFNIGLVHMNLGELQKALEHYHQALSLRRTIGDRRGEADTLNDIGLVHRNLGEMQKALEHYHLSLPLRRAASDRQGEAVTLNNIGSIYLDLGEMQKALEHYNQSLSLFRAVRDRRGEAITLDGIGVVYWRMGEVQKALEHHNQSLPLRRAVGDGRGEAITLNNIGNVYQTLGEMQKALEHYHLSLPLRRDMGDRRGEAVTLGSIGLAYQTLGETQKALEHYNRSLPLLRMIRDRRQEATVLNNLGRVYQTLGEMQKALEHYHLSLSLRRAMSDRRGEANTLTNIGGVYHDLGDMQRALDHLNQSLPLSRAVRDHPQEASTLVGMGRIYNTLNDPDQALPSLDRALTLAREVGARRVEAGALYEMARVERTRGNLAQARTRLEHALAIIESLRSNAPTGDLRASYLASVQSFYETYIDLLMQLHQQNPSVAFDAAALETSERARARSLLELLTEARVDIRQGVDPTLLEHERSLQYRLNAQAERQTRLLSGKQTAEQVAATAQEIALLTTEYEQLQARIRAASPRYAALTQPQTLSLKEIQQLLDANTLLLEYSLGDEGSYLWVIDQASMTSYKLPRRAEIEALARQVYQLLAARNQRPTGEIVEQRNVRIANADREYPQLASRLSRMILAPAATRLGARRLVIVADGALSQIPFAALTDPTGNGSQPLIATHEIVSLPSASVLATQRHQLAGRVRAAKLLAVLADPVFEPDDERVRAIAGQSSPGVSGSKQSRRLPPNSGARRTEAVAGLERAAGEAGILDERLKIRRLPFSREEANSIFALTPPGEGLKAMGFAASREAATGSAIAHYRIVHFATHALVNSEHPALSGIVLSLIDEQGREVNGFVRLNEIYNLRLPAELVVLSACQTALGKQIRGEGLIGLVRGFMYAGATRVVASLWKVDDEATADLMSRFYQRMLKGGAPTAALREAQLEMSRHKRWQNAYYWAGFTLQGEWK